MSIKINETKNQIENNTNETGSSALPMIRISVRNFVEFCYEKAILMTGEGQRTLLLPCRKVAESIERFRKRWEVLIRLSIR